MNTVYYASVADKSGGGAARKKFVSQRFFCYTQGSLQQNTGAFCMRTALYRSMMVFALLVSFGAFGDNQNSDCHSWWSELDGVHHCLLSGNGENNAPLVPKKEIDNTKASPEADPDDISAPSGTQQLPPPGLQIMGIPER